MYRILKAKDIFKKKTKVYFWHEGNRNKIYIEHEEIKIVLKLVLIAAVIQIAKSMIKRLSKLDIDYIKFQLAKPENVYSLDALADYQKK